MSLSFRKINKSVWGKFPSRRCEIISESNHHNKFLSISQSNMQHRRTRRDYRMRSKSCILRVHVRTPESIAIHPLVLIFVHRASNSGLFLFVVYFLVLFPVDSPALSKSSSAPVCFGLPFGLTGALPAATGSVPPASLAAFLACNLANNATLSS
jgi:hypothetical protein